MLPKSCRLRSLLGMAVLELLLAACTSGDVVDFSDAGAGAPHDAGTADGEAGEGGEGKAAEGGAGGDAAQGGEASKSTGGRISGGTSGGGRATGGGVIETTYGGAGQGTGGSVAGTAGRAAGGSTGQATGGSVAQASGGTAGQAAGGSAGQSTGGRAGQAQGGTDSGEFQPPFDRDPTSGVSIVSGDPLNPNSFVIATDARGHVFLAGATNDPATMGLTAFAPGVDSEAFAAKLNPAGQVVWVVPLLDCGEPKEIEVARDGAAYVVCPYMPDSSYVMSSAYSGEGLVAKLDAANGSLLYQAVISTGEDSFYPQAVAVDELGTAYAAGFVSLASGNFAERPSIVQVSSAGVPAWEYRPGAPEDNTAVVSDVVVASNGEVVFGGYFNHWLDFDSQRVESQALTGTYSTYNGYVARLDPSNRLSSGVRLGGTVFDLVWALEAQAEGRVLVAGMVSGTADVGGIEVTGDTEEGSAFVALLDDQGAADWVRVVDGPGSAYDVAQGASGEIYFVGQFPDGVLLHTYAPATQSLSSRSLAGGAVTRATSVAASVDGSVWVGGYYTGSADFGGGALTASSYSAFLVRIDPE